MASAPTYTRLSTFTKVLKFENLEVIAVSTRAGHRYESLFTSPEFAKESSFKMLLKRAQLGN